MGREFFKKTVAVALIGGGNSPKDEHPGQETDSGAWFMEPSGAIGALS